MAYSGKSTEQEEFESELAFNMATLRNNADKLDTSKQSFAKGLCDFYDKKEYLSAKQVGWALKLWQEVNSLGTK